MIGDSFIIQHEIPIKNPRTVSSSNAGISEATQINQVEAVLASVGIPNNFTTLNDFYTYYEGESKKWHMSRSAGINFANDYNTLYNNRQALIEAEGYTSPSVELDSLVELGAQEFRTNSLHVSAGELINFSFVLVLTFLGLFW